MYTPLYTYYWINPSLNIFEKFCSERFRNSEYPEFLFSWLGSVDDNASIYVTVKRIVGREIKHMALSEATFYLINTIVYFDSGCKPITEDA